MKRNSLLKDRWTLGVLLILLVLSFAVKCVRFSDPYFGAHIFRQLQTMSTIDAYVVEGVDLLHPKVNWDGYPGYIVAEFPFYQAASAILSKYTHQPLETARALNLMFAALTIAVVLGIATVWFSGRAACYSALIFAFSPLNIMFQRATLVDISATFFCVLAFFVFMSRWAEKNKAWLAVLCLTATLGVLIKPLYFVPVAVLFIWRFWQGGQEKYLKKNLNIVVCFFLMACALGFWMSLNSAGSSMARHISWTALIEPRFYINIAVRFCTQLLNPLTVLLFAIGALWLWKEFRKDERSVLLIIPVVYYGLFPDINFPHAYYSLILVPFLSIIAGCGAAWLEDVAVKQGLVKSERVIRTVFLVLVATFSVFMFFSNLTNTLVLPNQRYEKIEQEIRLQLLPMRYSVVYVDRNAQFSEAENLRNRPSVYLKSFFKDLPQTELLGQERDHPLVRTAVMYAIGQYGEMEYTDSPAKIDVAALQKRYDGQLSYVLFYLFEDRREILDAMKPHTLIYQSQDWVVFEVQKRD